MRLRRTWCSLFAVLGLASSALAQAPHLVTDANPAADRSPGSDPSLLRAGVSRTYFVANDDANGYELRVTDGTPAGTRLVRDLSPGPGALFASGMAIVGNTAFFAAIVGFSGEQLYRSDGTAGGTSVVRTTGPVPYAPAQLTGSGAVLYFTADDGSGRALWTSDGTDAGTLKLRDGDVLQIVAGPGGRAFFTIATFGGEELWTTDGTPLGTVAIRLLCPGSCDATPRPLALFGQDLYFVANDGTHGYELWRTDGTAAGTGLVFDLRPGADSPQIGALAAAGAYLYFTTSWPEPTLWRIDGSPTAPVALRPVEAEELTAAGGRLYFVGSDALNGRELWRSDGSAAGTFPLTDRCPGPCGFLPNDPAVRLLGTPSLLFFTIPGTDGATLWRSGGTDASTVPVVGGVDAASAVVMGSRVLFGRTDPATGHELWRSDGTVPGTVALTDRLANSSDPVDLVPAADRLFFRATRPDLGTELWVTEGTEKSTLSFDFVPGPGSPVVRAQGPLGRDLIFNLRVPGATPQEWRSDGTFAGTAPLGNLWSENRPAEMDGFALLSGGRYESQIELARTDGTPGGTLLLRDLDPGNYGSRPYFVGRLGDRQFFTAFDVYTSSALWRTDGTPEGTIRLGDGSAGAAVPLGSTMLMVAASFDHPLTGLWRSDGWASGTGPLEGIPGDQPQSPQDLALAGDRAFFIAWTRAAGREVWTTDGTGPGTRMVKDVGPGSAHGTYGGLAVLDGVAFFGGLDAAHGHELWRTDGTDAGTYMVKDVWPGPDSGLVLFQPVSLLSAGGRIWFAAYTPNAGVELWQSDGTETGTVQVGDLAPGPSSFRPEQLTADSERVYFKGNDGTHGWELWAADLLPSLSVENGDTLVEGDQGTSETRFELRLSRPVAQPLVVSYATADDTATAGADYVPAAGAVTFPPGSIGPIVVPVAVRGDLADEGDEAFTLSLTGAPSAIVTRRVATAVIRDDDDPSVSSNDIAVVEGDAGDTPATFALTLTTKDGAPAPTAKMVRFMPAEGTAAFFWDLDQSGGFVTFDAGSASGTARPATIEVRGDLNPEPDERFHLVLDAQSDVRVGAPGTGVILDDDDGGGAITQALDHGTALRRSFTGAPNSVWFAMAPRPYSSYEVVADEVSGDLKPLRMWRLLGSAPMEQSFPTGTGSSIALRFGPGFYDPMVQVQLATGGCQQGCGPEDTYRLRAYDTTLRGSRFNNRDGLKTFVILQNTSRALVNARLFFWNEEGSYLRESDWYLGPRASLVIDTSLIVPNAVGGLSIPNSAGYGELAGKLVTIDAATGAAHDTILTYQPR